MWPNINPMDFSIWSILESDVQAQSYSSVKCPLASCSALDEKIVRRSLHSVTSRWDLIVKAKGGHFEI